MLQVPGNLLHTKAMQRLIGRMLQSHSIKRIAGFQSSMGLLAFAFSLTNVLWTQVHLRHMLRSYTSI